MNLMEDPSFDFVDCFHPNPNLKANDFWELKHDGAELWVEHCNDLCGVTFVTCRLITYFTVHCTALMSLLATRCHKSGKDDGHFLSRARGGFRHGCRCRPGHIETCRHLPYPAMFFFTARPNKEKEKSKEAGAVEVDVRGSACETNRRPLAKGFMQRKWQGLVEKTRSDTVYLSFGPFS